MGKLVWHDLAHLVAMTSGTYLLWSSFWGILHRKFFWDMIGASLGPHGLVPPPSSAFFVNIIVNAPIVQIFGIINGILTLMIEWPFPKYLAETSFVRSHIAKSVFYFYCAFLAALVYQSVDCSLYYLIAIGMYTRAHMIGEIVPSAAAQKGSVGNV